MAATGRKQKACLLKYNLGEMLEIYTLQEKPPRRGKTLTPPHLQPAQSISTSC
jgi:rRNA maturation protein Nop10